MNNSSHEDYIRNLIAVAKINRSKYENLYSVYCGMCKPHKNTNVITLCRIPYTVKFSIPGANLMDIISTSFDNDFYVELEATIQKYTCNITCLFSDLFAAYSAGKRLKILTWRIMSEKKIIISDNVTFELNLVKPFVDNNISLEFYHIDFACNYRKNGQVICYDLLRNLHKIKHMPTDILWIVSQFATVIYTA